MIRDGADNVSPELIETYKSMIAAYDEDPANLERYADAYKNAYLRICSYYMNEGDKDAAREYLGKALELDPENAALAKLVQEL